MTASVAPRRPTVDDARATSLLDLVEEGARGAGSVHFLADDAEPTPTATLWADAGRAASWMGAHVGAGNTVAAVLTNTRAAVTALLGAWRAGCTVASLPLPGRGTPADVYVAQLGRFCVAAGADLLLIDAAYAALVEDPPVRLATFDDVGTGGPARDLDGAPALVQFTSGSLGVPKGISLSLDAVGAHVTSIRSALAIGPGDASCSWLPLSHDMGLIGQLLTALIAGAPEYGDHSLTLMKPESFMANPMSWLRTCSETRSTITTVPNFALDLAIRTGHRAGALDLSPLRTCIVGSESVRAETLTRFTETFAATGFRDIAFCPAYGMAEATLAVTMVRPDEPWRAIAAGEQDPDADATTLVSTGAPIDGVDVRVAAPDGRVGPIEFRSTSMLSRYVGADLDLTDDGYFVTGDLGLVERDELFVLGRGDEVIVVAGRNVYPADVESAVDHEAVRRGCLAAVAVRGGGMAVVAEPSRSTFTTDELEGACRRIRSLVASRTGSAPNTVAFVRRGALPKTPSGKLRRRVIGGLLDADAQLLARVDFR